MATNNTKHAVDCKMVFGRKDPNCPRCQELLSGAPARDGWQKQYFSREKERIESISLHFSSHKHLSGGCGPVCTFGDY